MSTRLTRRGSFVLGLSIVIMLLVSAPMLAFANSSAPTTPPGTTPPGQTDAVPPGQDDSTAPGNSENAQSQTAGATAAPATSAAPGNSGDAPGHNKDTSTTAATPPGNSGSSNAGGGSSSAGGNSSNAGGSGGSNTSVPEDHGKKSTTGTPNGQGDGPTTGNDGTNCDGSQNSDTGHGANQSGDFDNTCSTSPSGPAPNGNGGGAARGKPCAGCVGNADDKNPPGQSHRPEDKNNGFKCDGNNGAGRGNPAFTSCVDDDDDEVCTSWSIVVTITKTGNGTGSVTDGTSTTSSTATWTYDSAAARTLSSTATGGSTVTSGGGTQRVSFSAHPGCAGSYSVTFHKGNGEPCPPNTDHAGEFVDPCDDSDKKCPANGKACPTIVTVNPDPDLVVTPVTPVIPPDEVLGIILCPDGSFDATGECPEGFIRDAVLGIRLNQGPEVAPAVVNNPAPAVAASLLPFTGGNIFPFVLVSLSLIGAGLPALRRKASSTN